MLVLVFGLGIWFLAGTKKPLEPAGSPEVAAGPISPSNPAGVTPRKGGTTPADPKTETPKNDDQKPEAKPKTPLPGANGERFVFTGTPTNPWAVYLSEATELPKGGPKAPWKQVFPSGTKFLQLGVVFTGEPTVDSSARVFGDAGEVQLADPGREWIMINSTYIRQLHLRPKSGVFPDGAYQAEVFHKGTKIAVLNWSIGKAPEGVTTAKDSGKPATKEAEKPIIPGPGEAKNNPPVQYTIRNLQGSRTGRVREAVLATVKMTADQVRAWVEDPKAANENRSAKLYEDRPDGEWIGRDAMGRLQYTVRDRAGIRTSRDRASVLKTRGMAADQLLAWSQTPEGKAEGREFKPEATRAPQFVVSSVLDVSWRVFSQDMNSATEASKLTDDKIREWVADPKGEQEGRGAIFNRQGSAEIIWRGPGGQLLYSLRDEFGTRTSKDRDSVLETLRIRGGRVRDWVEDEKAVKDGRAATFYQAGYDEVISRGMEVEPPR